MPLQKLRGCSDFTILPSAGGDHMRESAPNRPQRWCPEATPGQVSATKIKQKKTALRVPSKDSPKCTLSSYEPENEA